MASGNTSSSKNIIYSKGGTKTEQKEYFCPILIAGHPRCGTGYAANLCRQMGLDIGHERLGSNGISSWMFAVDDVENPYALDQVSRSRHAIKWKYLIMPVRDLTMAAGSVIRDSIHAPPSYEFRRKHIYRLLGIDLEEFKTPLERAVRSVISWCRIIMKQSPDLWFRIEDQHEPVRNFLIKNGLSTLGQGELIIDTSPVNADKLYRGIQYSKPVIHKKEWAGIPGESQLEIFWYCETFGYHSPLANLRFGGHNNGG